MRMTQQRRQEEVVDNIRVAVRLRPPMDFELQRNNTFELL